MLRPTRSFSIIRRTLRDSSRTKKVAFALLIAALGVVAYVVPLTVQSKGGSKDLSSGSSLAVNRLAATLQSNGMAPLALAAEDFDGDGASDLVSGYGAGTGILAIYRGNPEARAPRSEQALEDVKVGRFAAPFLPEPTMLDLPEAPDFLAASDFNRDGFKDVLAAARGGQSVYFFAGDGKGKFAPVEQVFMPGNISALLVGDTGVRNGMPEVVIGIASASGSKALVYSGADSSIWGMPRSFDLPAEPKGFAIGELNDDEKLDLAVAAGQQVIIIPGVSEAEWFGGSARAIEQIAFPAAVTAVSVGQFIWDREGRDEVAALSADGTISIAAHRNLDKRQYSDQEEKLKIRKAGEFRARQKRPELFQQFMESLVQRPSNDNSWAIAQSLAGKANASGKSPVFLASRVSNSFTTDLVFAESGGSKLNLVKNEPAGPTVEAITADGNSAFEAQAAADKSQTSNMSASEDLIAVLPMRLNLDTKTDFVMLREGDVDPKIVIEAVNAAMVVDRTDDTAAATGCVTATPNDCSLRGAIIKANTTADDDIITFPAGAQTYTLTLGPRDDEFNLLGASASTGDLDIRDAITAAGNAALDGNLTITGNGIDTTIIQAGASQAAGIDRVIDINNFSGSRVQITVVLSGLTIRNGNVPEVDVDPGPDVQNFQPDGGGIQMDGLDTNVNTPGTGAVGSLTISGCKVTTSLAGGQGGGVDSTAATLIINSSSIISSNQTQRSAGGGVFWGSGNVIAAQNLQINTSTIDSNTSGGNAPISLGGGVAVQGIGANHTFTTATITNNTATAIDNATDGSGAIPNGSGGGGIFFDDGALTMTGGSITSNKSNTNGGGLLFAGSTATINNVSITSNTADFNNDGFGNGGGIYNLFGAITIGNATACTINSNSAVNGGGIFNTWNLQTLNASGSITMTNGTISSNSAKNNGGGFAMDVRVPTTLGTVNLNTVTLASNTANSDSAGGGDGGAIHVTTGTINSLNGVTIDNNVANSGNGDGLRQAGGTITGAGTLNFNSGDSIYLSGGTFTSTSGFVNLTGNFTRDSGNTFNHGSGTFNFNGSGAQQLNGTATSVIFNNFIVNKSNTLSTGGSLATVTVNNLTMTAGTFTAPATLDINGNTTLAVGSTLTAGANITAAGNWTNNGGTFTPGSGTITWDGAAAQQINGTPVTQTFNNFTVNKANTLSTGGSTTALVMNNLTMTAGTFTAPASLDINGNTLLTAGTLTAGATITAAGSWTNNGGTFTPGSGTVMFDTSSVSNLNGSAVTQTFNNFVVDKSGGSLTGAGPGFTTLTLNGAMTLNAGTFSAGTITGISLPGNWTNNGGTFSPGSSNVTFNSTTATQSITGTPVTQTFFTITMNKTGQTLNTAGSTTALDLDGTLVLNAGTFTAPATLTIGGDFTQATGTTFTTGTGTVTFDGAGAQNINGTLATKIFNNFTVNKSNTLSGAAGTTGLDINGNVTLTAGTFAAGTATAINVAGNWTNNGGTFTGGTGTVIFDGGAGQTIGGTNATTFNNLTNSNANGLAMSHDNTVSGVLALTSSDIIVAATKILTMPGTGSSSGTFDVVGSVKRTGFALNVPLSFGNPFNTIEVDSGGLPTDIVVTLVKAAPGAFPTAVNRTYTITPNGGSPNATLRLHYRDTELNGNIESQLDLWRSNVGVFVDEQRTGANTTDNWVEKSGVTTFSDWTLATHVNSAPTITPNPATTTVGVQTSAIVLDRQAVDAAFVMHFKITGITNGTLFKSDGLTQINNNDFITYAEGTAGVKFTPSPNSVATGSFTVQTSSDISGNGLSSGTTGTINVNQGTTTVTITSDLPDPSSVGQVVTVNYSVLVATGAGTPTGDVVITISGGLETCTGTVAAGTCNITLTAVGSRTLTATYAGDANFVGGNDTEPHEVAGPADAVDDNYSTFKNTQLNIAAPGVLTNDIGSPTVSGVGACADVTAPFDNCATTAGGEVDVNADGSFSYTPLAGYVGADSFTYTATNGGGSDSATVNITVSDDIFINEILFDPPGVDAPNEYIELRSMASATIPAGTYLVVVDGDSANAGDVTTIINLTGLTFGSNGFLVLLQNGNTYTTAAGATVVTSAAPGFSGLPGGIWQADGGATDLQNDSANFMLIQTNVAPTLSDDIDTDNNGSTNPPFASWNLLDSINVLDAGANARGYGAFGYRNQAGTGGSNGAEVIITFIATYVGRSGDTTGSTAADWVAAGPLAGAAPNWLLGAAADVEPDQFANQPLNHIGTTNFDVTAPTVLSITRADTNPTNASSVDFTVTFSESVTGVDVTDFALTTTGTASATINSVTGGPTTWNVALTSVTGDGTIRLDLTDDDSIKDGANNPIGGAGAQNFTTGEIYDVDHTAPTADITDVAPDPRATSVASITIVFNEAITGFNLADLSLKRNGGSNLLTGAQTLTSGDNITWTLGNLSGITGTDGSYVLTLTAAGAGITDGVGNALAADASDSWLKDASVPSVDITDVTPDPRTTSVSSISIVFSEAVTGFDLADLDLTRNGGAELLTGAQTLTSGDNITWTLGNLSGLTGTDGTYLLSLTAAGSGIVDGGGNALSNSASDSWVKDSTGPSVTINQAVGQADPTSTSPINFTVVFNEAVANFINTDVSLSGAAGATTAVVTETAPNNGTTYNVAVSGMTGSGDVIASLAAGVASDALGNTSQASTSTDNTVQFNLITNVAPVLDNTGNMTLSAINEDVADASNPGTLVSDIIASAGGDRITDADAGALEGIAVVAANNANGTWQYSINNGTNWTAFGSPDATTARLLAADVNTRVRFVPNANFNGTVALGITFRAWDQTTGANGGTADVSVNGGNTAFSTATETADITVNAVNDAPTANAQAVVTNEDAPLGITLSGSDVETAAGSLTFTVTVQPTNGVLSGTAPNLTYTPNANFNGADSFKFTVTDTGDGASPALTSTEAIVSITVDAVNDGPANTVPGAQSTATNTPLTFSAGNSNLISIADIDAGTNPVQVTLTATNGTFSLSGTSGLVFSVGDGTADATMTFTGTITNINNALNGLVFTPTAGFNGAASLQIITNDQGNTGSGGAQSDTDTVNITVSAGGTLQFSAATYTVAENGGPATITITRSGGTNGTATVLFETSHGTAGAGDYTTVSQTVTFVDGDTSETVNVPITNDSLNEPDETVNLTLSNAGGSGTLGTPAAAVLTITNDDTPTISFSAATYAVAEDGLHIDITVNRTGDASAVGSVDYATSDLFGLADCATINGNASSRCDYLPALGTLNFAAAQTSRTFRVFVSDDVRAEGAEVLTLTLSGPAGGVLGATNTATLTINDHVVAPGSPNPIDDPAFFIRMLYVDILSREPDTIGFNNWLATINGCPNGGFGNVNTTCDRVHVAKSFFHSAEFGMRGYFIYRFFDAGLGQRPTYQKFLRGMQQIGGSLSPADSDAAKMEFVEDFIASAEFQAIYAGLLVPAQANAFITKLEQTSGITIPEPTRSQLVADMASSAKTPAETLRAFMETEAIFQGFYNRGFVSMLYFGYLHRDPDTIGFDNWLMTLNATGDYRHLTFGFIYSTEYRSRFGTP